MWLGKAGLQLSSDQLCWEKISVTGSKLMRFFSIFGELGYRFQNWPHTRGTGYDLSRCHSISQKLVAAGGPEPLCMALVQYNSSYPWVKLITQTLNPPPPPPPSSLLEFSLGWLTLGKQVLHYAWLLGMRSVLVSNSLAEQPQGYRPCKNPRCLTAQKGLRQARSIT